ncbi:MAG: NACHT domain-containing protein [Planctomycetes bacterium]|nr:NACHT domain-containing protein [Planctomycetota bacterium]
MGNPGLMKDSHVINKRHQFTNEEKANAVQRAHRLGNIAQAARDLDLLYASLRKWVKQAEVESPLSAKKDVALIARAPETSKQTSQANTEVGNAFEQKVARLYEALGYSVQNNVLLAGGGQQVDLLVNRTFPGIGQARVVVECKFRTSGQVSNQDVFDFRSLIRSLNESDGITGGVMVSNGKYSAPAQSAAKKSGLVQLLTTLALEDQILNVHEALASFAHEYETRNIYEEYIPLKAKNRRSESSLFQVDIEDIESELLNWIHSGPHGFATVLGDYGAGKTTLLERIKYKLALEHIENYSELRPVLFLLRDYHKCGSLEALVIHTLRREFNCDVPPTVFWRFAAEGKLVILLDGFDEMSPQVDGSKRVGNILLLARLLNMKSKAILTCRPTYFVDVDEFNQAIDSVNHLAVPMEIELTDDLNAPGAYQVKGKKRPIKRKRKGEQQDKMRRVDAATKLERRLEAVIIQKTDIPRMEESEIEHVDLKALSEEQVDESLRKHDSDFRKICMAGWEEVKAYLSEVYDLRDLVKRPILLKMVIETLLMGVLDIKKPKENIGPAQLYEIYLSKQFEWDTSKGSGRGLLTKDQRRQFAVAIALAMFDSEQLEVGYEDILRVVEKRHEVLEDLRKQLDHVSVEEVATDVQTCTFLRWGDSGQFCFTHKSFMEFFVARHLRQCIKANREDKRLHSPLPREIKYFLGSFANWMPELLDWLINSLKATTKDKVWRSNIAGILFAAGGKLPPHALSRCSVSGVDFIKAMMDASEWRRFTLEGVSISEWTTKNCTILDTSIRNAPVNGWLASHCRIVLNSEQVTFHNCQWDNSNLRLSGRDVSIIDCRFCGGEVIFIGDVCVEGGRIEEGLLTVVGSDSYQPRVIRVTFSEEEISCVNSILEQCELSGKNARFSGSSVLTDCSLSNLKVEVRGELETGGEYKRPRIATCRLKRNVHVIAKDAMISKCEFEQAELELASIAIHGCVINDAFVRLSGSLLMEDCKITESRLDMDNQKRRDQAAHQSQYKRELHRCKYRRVEGRYSADSIQRCEFVESVSSITSNSEVEFCTFRQGVVHVIGSTGGTVNISRSSFENTEITVYASQVAASSKWKVNSFRSCSIVGLCVSIKSSIAQQFPDCDGVVLLGEELQKEKSHAKEMKTRIDKALEEHNKELQIIMKWNEESLRQSSFEGDTAELKADDSEVADDRKRQSETINEKKTEVSEIERERKMLEDMVCEMEAMEDMEEMIAEARKLIAESRNRESEEAAELDRLKKTAEKSRREARLKRKQKQGLKTRVDKKLKKPDQELQVITKLIEESRRQSNLREIAAEANSKKDDSEAADDMKIQSEAIYEKEAEISEIKRERMTLEAMVIEMKAMEDMEEMIAEARKLIAESRNRENKKAAELDRLKKVVKKSRREARLKRKQKQEEKQAFYKALKRNLKVRLRIAKHDIEAERERLLTEEVAKLVQRSEAFVRVPHWLLLDASNQERIMVAVKKLLPEDSETIRRVRKAICNKR